MFTDDTLEKCVEDYDVFIVGSDQVWNPKYMHWGYTLSFVPEEKRKISYAASIGVSMLTDKQKNSYSRWLCRFHSVSVREQDAVETLEGLITSKIKLVLDPVFLLNRESWNSFSSKRRIKESYVFAYFLGGGEEIRNLVREYAKKNNLRLVTMPYIWQWYTKIDRKFGDICLYDVSPEDFVSLIRYADCIITDSFHAVAFSCIYNKEFFVFGRSDQPEMSSRIASITSLFGTESRFLNEKDKMTFTYMQNQSGLNYSWGNSNCDNMRKESMSFLINSLN